MVRFYFPDAVKTDNIQTTSEEQSNQQHNFFNQPYVAGNYTTNVTYQIGTHAFLHCKVSATVSIIYFLILISYYKKFYSLMDIRNSKTPSLVSCETSSLNSMKFHQML